VLAQALDLLRCPVCAGQLLESDGALRCPSGHSFDIARQGYVNLVPGAGDSAGMVEARQEFLAAGHYRRLAEELAKEATAVGAPGVVLDVGAGTGHYLARVLDARPERVGLALDTSSAALRRAVRAHPRAAAAGADAWKPLPLRDEVAALILSVFAPRNGLLSVPDEKADRLDEQLAPNFELSGRRTVEHSMFLAREEAAQLVRMGPSAWHVDEQTVAERLALLPDPLTVTASVTLSRYLTLPS